MVRILFFVFLAFMFWLLIRLLGGSRGRKDAAAEAATPPERRVESIQQCAWCGVHVPTTQALTLPDGRVYCSEVHRDAARHAPETADRSRP